MRSGGVVPQARSRYRIATIDYIARDEAQLLGSVGRARKWGLLRDALVAHVRARGFQPEA
jgi:hypothetical protein